MISGNDTTSLFWQTLRTSNSHLDSISFNTVLFSRTVKFTKTEKESYRLSNNRSLQPRYLLFEHRYSIWRNQYLYFSDRKRAPISYVGQITPRDTTMQKDIGHHQSSTIPAKSAIKPQVLHNVYFNSHGTKYTAIIKVVIHRGPWKVEANRPAKESAPNVFIVSIIRPRAPLPLSGFINAVGRRYKISI